MKTTQTTVTPLKLRKLTPKQLLILLPQKTNALQDKLEELGLPKEQSVYLTKAAGLLFYSIKDSSKCLQSPKDVLLKFNLRQINLLLQRYEKLEDKGNG